tara:strand:- start:156 stop:581 length:426 start_codon:yes stop_codon:yes gene_type:complete
MREFKRIILHCTATREGQHYNVKDIRLWHTSPPRNWSDIGYHYLIQIDGTIEIGRPITKIGAHTKGENEDSIGIAYVGGLDRNTDRPKDTMTVEQEIAFLRLVDSSRLIFGEISLHGHNEFSSKACPSFNVNEKFKFLNKE